VGKTYSRTRHSYAVKLAPDGSFLVPDVRPGSYALSIQVTEPRNTNQLGLENRVLATAQLSFLVPEVLPDRKIRSIRCGELGGKDCAAASCWRHGRRQSNLKRLTVRQCSSWRITGASMSCCNSGQRGAFHVTQQTVFLKQVEEAFGKDKTVCHRGCELGPRDVGRDCVCRQTSDPLGAGLPWRHPIPKSPGAKIIKDYSVGLPQIWLIGPDGRIVARDRERGEWSRSHDSAVRPD